MNTMSSSVEERLGSLTRDKAELLKLLRERQSRAAQTIHPFPRDERTGSTHAPLSWAQQRLWWVNQLEGAAAAYYVPLAMRMRGDLDVGALGAALDAIVQRHEALRTVFAGTAEDPKQQIAREGHFALERTDLSQCADAARAGRVKQEMIAETRKPFDLRNGPLVRGRLLHLAVDEHVLLITMHHIVSDGWSMGVFSRELAELYRAFHGGRANPLPALPIQYADYAQWQQRLGSQAAMDKYVSWWRARLQDAAPELSLPTDRARPEAPTYRGETVRFVLDAQLTSSLIDLAQRHEMTLFMLLHAAWAILLSRLSGQADVSIGTPVANRTRPELEGLIGFFVNMVVLRVDVHGQFRLADFLRQVREETLAAFEHQEVPFEKVVEALRPDRSINRNPLFQVTFSLQNSPGSAGEIPGLAITPEEGIDEPCTFELSLAFERRDGKLLGGLNYSTDLFERQTMQRWAARLEVLLRSMIAGEHGRVDDLDILPEAERKEVVERFNATATDFPHDSLVHQVFEQRVSQTPDALAVSHEKSNLTYAELNRRANQLAHYLLGSGMQAGEYVPIVMRRCPQLLVAQLAVLKCGGAYVPLDPKTPEERQAFMLQDCGAQRVLVENSEQVKPAEMQWIDCERFASAIAGCAESDIPLQRSAQSAAYVMYTSGSTGIPKGVIVPHRAINRLAINNGYARIEPADRIAHCSNPAFDAATFEIWGALLNGASVVIVPHSVMLQSEAFAAFIDAERVTMAFQTTALFNQHSSAAPRAFSRLRYVLFGGEAGDPNAVRRVLRDGAPEFLLNVYGPTETTTFATSYPVVSAEVGSLPIGKPIANTQIHILDSRMRPVPIGVAGEIHIGGAGVALGYLNRPELTAERFIADPFSASPEARLYRSGDFGRWREDGNIEFLGRRDHQVKIRGFRIELGEIETHLLRDPRVSEATVLAREDEPGEKRLVAYVVPRASSDIASGFRIEDLRARLSAALPDHMVPGAFVVLDRLPLTPNGKVDRRALPVPDHTALMVPEYEPPKGEVEEALARIWQDLLHVERVGRHDNFFSLGGHSLLATRVIAYVREVLDVEVPLQGLFENPTIAGLARLVVQEVATELLTEA